MEILTAREEHLPIIRQIAFDTWPDTFGQILSKEQIAYMLEMMYSIESLSHQISTLGHVFILAKEKDQFFGYASYEINYKGDPKTKIHKIYILPDSQGKGVGKILIQNIIDAAKTHENSTLTLNVNRDNNAISFYKKAGFSIVGQEDIDIGHGFLMEDAIMERKIQ